MVMWLPPASATSSSDNLQNATLHYATKENKVLDFVQGEQTPEFGNYYQIICYFVQKKDCNEILSLLENGAGGETLEIFSISIFNHITISVYIAFS
jgi:hypothetical protein